MLLRAAAKENGWNLNMGGIASCGAADASFAALLGKIKEAFDKDQHLTNLLLDSFFSAALNLYQESWRKAQIHAIELGVPTQPSQPRLRSMTATAPIVSRQPAPGPARLLRRAHLRAHRPTERQIRPHQLDRTGGRVSSTTYNA